MPMMKSGRAKDSGMTVREMRNKLFAVRDQNEPAKKYFPDEAKPGETVEKMRHRLFELEPQDGPYTSAKDSELKPIPTEDQVLGEGAVGDGELRPIPVNDTEWNDPKARGSYKLTTSAALKTPAAVAEAYGVKDPEGFKKTFGKDAFIGTWTSGQYGEIYKIARLKTWGQVVESAHSPGTFNASVNIGRDPGTSARFSSVTAAKKWVEREAGFMQQREVAVKVKDGAAPIPVTDTEWNDPKPRGSYKLTTSAALRTPSEVKEAYGKKDPEGFKRTFGKDASDDCMECGKSIPYGDEFCKSCASKLGLKQRDNSMHPGSKFEQWDAKRHGMTLEKYRKEYANDGLKPIPIKDSFNGLVGKLERGGKSKEYATKIAGKVAAEKKAKDISQWETGSRQWEGFKPGMRVKNTKTGVKGTVHYAPGSGGVCAVEYDGGSGDDQSWKVGEMEPLGIATLASFKKGRAKDTKSPANDCCYFVMS